MCVGLRETEKVEFMALRAGEVGRMYTGDRVSATRDRWIWVLKER